MKNYKQRRLLLCAYKQGINSVTEEGFYSWLNMVAPLIRDKIINTAKDDVE